MLAYLSQNADKRIIASLMQEGFEIIPLAPFSTLASPVNTHADMLLCAANDILFVHKNYVCQVKGFNRIIKIDEPISAKYPNDILLNIAVIGKNAFANTKHSSKSVLNLLKNNGFVIHHVSQGYAHCSTCIVNENAIITADHSIENAALKSGIDVLKIESGHVSLPPYDYGFIGGASGSHQEKIYFCGSLKYHPDGEKIRKFCQIHGKTVIELCDAPLMDVGGILFK